MSDDAALTFALRLLGTGVELILRNKRLYVWPGRAYKHLPDADKDFIREHRDELKSLAASKVLPETTVVWAELATVTAATATVTTATPTPDTCIYCGRPCVGPDHRWYRVLHWRDPEEVKKREDRATQEMFESMRRAQRGSY